MKLSHHDHSDPDMVDGIALLIKMQITSNNELWNFKHETETLYQDSGVLQMGNWSQLCTLMKNKNFIGKEETF